MKSLFILLAAIPELVVAACPGGLAAGINCVDAGATSSITAHSVCKDITNSHASGKALMVPTKTSAEWSAFYNGPPAGVSVSSCGMSASLCTGSGGTWGTSLVATGACDWTYTTPGSFSWTVPAGVTSISAVCVGGGGDVGNVPANVVASGGGGGALVWGNFSVTPGTNLTVVVGGRGAQSSFNGMIAGGGGPGIVGANSIGGAGGTYSGGNGGGNGGKGGNAGSSSLDYSGGGGGAGGYSGKGGDGASGAANVHADGSSGAGGGGGGGTTGGGAGGGGGVGLYGQGANGAGGLRATNNYTDGGKGGSGGGNGTYPQGGTYGGGAGMSNMLNMSATGACRIIWGAGRAFPSTLTGAP